MPKRFPSPPKSDPDEGNSHPMNADCWATIRELAADPGAEDELAELLAREGLGGRPTAKLLAMAVRAMEKYAPLATEVDRYKLEAESASRRKDSARRFSPVTLDEHVAQGELIHQAEVAWGKALSMAGEAERAQSYVAFLKQAFPALFGVEPERLKNSQGEWTERILGECPPELQIWFAARRVDPRVFGSWQAVGVELPAKLKRRVVAIAPVNRRS